MLKFKPVIITSIFLKMSNSSPTQIIEYDMSRIVKIVESTFTNDSLHIADNHKFTNSYN